MQAATCGDANGATADDADYTCPTGYRYKGASVDSTVIEFLTPENAKRDACCELVSAACNTGSALNTIVAA
jgi:hypothetical protein